MLKFRVLLFSLVLLLTFAGGAFAQEVAAIDTSKLSAITQSLDNVKAWLSGSVLTAVIGLAVAGLIIVIAKFAARKAKPGG